MPNEPTVEEVRELLADVNRCLEHVGAPGCRRATGMFVGERLPMLAALCRAYLAAQDAEDERAAPDVPQAIKDELFHQACLCADTEAAAQKQSCACRTAMLLEQIEQWGKSLTKPAAKPQMSAGEFAGWVVKQLEKRILIWNRGAAELEGDVAKRCQTRSEILRADGIHAVEFVAREQQYVAERQAREAAEQRSEQAEAAAQSAPIATDNNQ